LVRAVAERLIDVSASSVCIVAIDVRAQAASTISLRNGSAHVARFLDRKFVTSEKALDRTQVAGAIAIRPNAEEALVASEASCGIEGFLIIHHILNNLFGFSEQWAQSNSTS